MTMTEDQFQQILDAIVGVRVALIGLGILAILNLYHCIRKIK